VSEAKGDAPCASATCRPTPDEAERRYSRSRRLRSRAEAGLRTVTVGRSWCAGWFTRGLHRILSTSRTFWCACIYVVYSVARQCERVVGFEGLIEAIRYYFQMPVREPDMVAPSHACLPVRSPPRSRHRASSSKHVAEIAAAIRAVSRWHGLRDDSIRTFMRADLQTLRGSSAWLVRNKKSLAHRP